MTVAELIAALEKMPQDAAVCCFDRDDDAVEILDTATMLDVMTIEGYAWYWSGGKKVRKPYVCVR